MVPVFFLSICAQRVQGQELACQLKTLHSLYNGLTQGCVKCGLQKEALWAARKIQLEVWVI